MSGSRFSLTKAVHAWIEAQQWPSGWIVDMTCGTGCDTMFLRKTFADRELLAIDIQEAAIEQSYNKIQQSMGSRAAESVHWKVGCHSQVGKWLDESRAGEVALAMYNLGYLPGSDKNVITQGLTTILSLRELKERLSSMGVISLMLYTGHSGGQEEADLVCQELLNWSSDQWKIWQMHRFNENSKKPAPYWLLVQKS